MFCHKCGHKLPEDVAFCQKCGEKLIEDKEILISPVAITNPITPGSKKMHKKLIIGFAGIAIAIITIIAIVFNLGGGTEYPDELLYEGLPVSRFLEMTRDNFITEFGEHDQSDPDYPGIRYDDKGISLINFSEETGKMIHMNFYSENCTLNGKKFVDTTTEKAMKNISTPEGTQIAPSNIIEYSLYSKINQVTDPKYKFFRVIEKDHTIEYITYEDYVIYMFLYSNQLDRFVGDESASLGSEADSADAYSGELLYRGEAIANLLGSTPEELNKVFCAPTGGTPVTGEMLYGGTEYYTYDGIAFLLGEQGTVVQINVGADAVKVNSATLDQNRAGIINLLGTPGYEALLPEDESGEGLGDCYIMEYTEYDDGTITTIEMPDADSKANAVTIARYDDGLGDEEYLESNTYIDGQFEWVTMPEAKDIYINNVRMGCAIQGTIKNITSETFSTVGIQFSLYDSSGNQIGDTSDHISNFVGGNTWKFEATILNGNPSRFEFAGITAW